jgi:nucleotide-binding universal stress UspA family protein
MTHSVKSILWATDFSEREEIERDFAWSLASAFKADLTLLHALVLHDYRVAPEFAESMLRDVLERLKKRKAREKASFQVREDVVQAMSVAGGIVSYAEANKFDLIAILTTTHSKLARFFLGSNTERVISFSEVPVFAIPAACSEG